MIARWLKHRFTAAFSTLLLSGLIASLTVGSAAHSAEPIDFPITTLAGEQQRLSDYRGRWVVVNYWATWCPPCRKELPELDLFSEHHKDDAVVLGINFEDISTEELQQFIDEQFLSFPMFHQRPSRSTPFGRLSGLPTTYLLDPEGAPVAMHTGGITADMLDFFIENYLPEDSHQAAPSGPPASDSPASPPAADGTPETAQAK